MNNQTYIHSFTNLSAFLLKVTIENTILSAYLSKQNVRYKKKPATNRTVITNCQTMIIRDMIRMQCHTSFFFVWKQIGIS